MKGQIRLIIIIILLSLSVVFWVTSCGRNDAKSSEITVYYVKSDRIVDIAVNNFEKQSNIKLKTVGFDNEKEMDDQFVNDLNTRKQVPDVVILNDRTTLDLSKIYKSIFEELDKFTEQDESMNSGTYLKAAIDGGKVDGKQIFLPISFNMPVMFFDAKKAQSAGVSVSLESDIHKLFSEIESHINSNAQNEGLSTIFNLYEKPILTLVFRTSNIEIINGKGEYVLKKDEFKKVADYAKTIYDEQKKAVSVAQKYGNDFSSLAGNTLFLLWDNINLMHDARAFDSLYRAGNMNNIDLISFPALKEGERVATIKLYGGITKSSANKDASYEFLRTLMDSYAYSTNEVVYTTPVKLDSFVDLIEQLKKKENISQSGRSPVTIYPMSDAMGDKIYKILNSTTLCNIPNTMIEDIMEGSFAPYLEGSKSYEDCFANFERTLQIYMEE